ncbi:MAG: 2,4-dienoyl-CoA reductase (NADPH2) [Enterobacterales bacterium]|jgi:2,4-dienoyl-CoA reductase (NADPH2)
MSTQSPPYSKLLSPLDLGVFEVKNRLIMGSMHLGLEEAKDGITRIAEFYKRRAKGGVGMIVTGGISPNIRGSALPFAAKMTSLNEMKEHQIITDAVHQYDSKILMQILHSGRYSYHPFAAAPSRVKSPISPFAPWSLSKSGVLSSIKDYAKSCALAKQAGYDGVELMGSEGYFINQFIAQRTNKRNDAYGGSYENRMRIAVDIVDAARQEVGDDFLLMFRLSMLDLVEQGSSFEEVMILGQALEKAGINVINTGIGWHEARIPTIATSVPRGAFTWVTKAAKEHLSVPLVTTNRINSPEVCEQILSDGDADLISMARPLLADPDFIVKAEQDLSEEINTCIGCNQACLDHIFKRQIASCLVNPKACYETEFSSELASTSKKVAVIGAGVAGMSCALESAKKGHDVTLFEKAEQIGGQFLLAARIPGKEEFEETLRYFKVQLEKHNVKICLSTEPTADYLTSEMFNHLVVATGVSPRKINLKGTDNNPKIISYPEAISGKIKIGKKVAVIGAGGIGFDVSEFLLHENSNISTDVDEYLKYWGIDKSLASRSGIENVERVIPEPSREIILMQRKPGRLGKGLGKTTGWIHRQMLKDGQVKMLSEVEYLAANEAGLLISHKGKEIQLDVDHIIICAGQTSVDGLFEELKTKGVNNKAAIETHIIGGAALAAELDAKRAIKDGIELAHSF